MLGPLLNGIQEQQKDMSGPNVKSECYSYRELSSIPRMHIPVIQDFPVTERGSKASGLQGHLHSCAHTHTDTHVHITKNKIF